MPTSPSPDLANAGPGSYEGSSAFNGLNGAGRSKGFAAGRGRGLGGMHASTIMIHHQLMSAPSKLCNIHSTLICVGLRLLLLAAFSPAAAAAAAAACAGCCPGRLALCFISHGQTVDLPRKSCARGPAMPMVCAYTCMPMTCSRRTQPPRRGPGAP